MRSQASVQQRTRTTVRAVPASTGGGTSGEAATDTERSTCRHRRRHRRRSISDHGYSSAEDARLGAGISTSSQCPQTRWGRGARASAVKGTAARRTQDWPQASVQHRHSSTSRHRCRSISGHRYNSAEGAKLRAMQHQCSSGQNSTSSIRKHRRGTGADVEEAADTE